MKVFVVLFSPGYESSRLVGVFAEAEAAAEVAETCVAGKPSYCHAEVHSAVVGEPTVEDAFVLHRAEGGS